MNLKSRRALDSVVPNWDNHEAVTSVNTRMDESGIDMGFDLAALEHGEDFNLEYSNEFDQALSMLSSPQDFMYYELKSRAPDTGRCVIW